MENTEIMNEVVEMAEDSVSFGTGTGVKVVAGIGVGVLVGGILYKYVVKPTYGKIKTKIQERKDKDSQADDEE